MKIYDDYFGNWKHWRSDAIPVSICRFPPKSWNGAQLLDVAPPEWLLEGVKTGNVNLDLYTKIYQQMLRNVGRETILRKLEELSGGRDVVLVCYEAPGDFCHRHLLKEFLENDDDRAVN